MDESFKRLKRKYQLNAIIKSAVCGLSFGLLVVGICLLALKLNAVMLNVGYYFLIGIGSAVISGGLMFLIFNPSDKRVARRLDKEFKLNERAQTALAYQKKDGILIQLQREDTATKLRSINKLKFRFSRIWQLCTVFVLAFAMALTGILVPAKVAQATVPPIGSSDYPWRLSQLESFKVRELIANVRASHLDDNTKNSVAVVLEDLLEDLESATTVGVKDSLVLGAVDNVDAIITPLNYYQTYVKTLESMSQKYLSHAVLRGVIVYRSETLTTNKEAEAFYNKQFELVGEAISGPINALRKEFDNDEELLDKIGLYSIAIASAINYASDSDNKDEIYTSLDWFVGQLIDLESQLMGSDESVEQTSASHVSVKDGETEEISQWQSKLDSIFLSFSDRLSAALEIQTYNFAMNKFIGNCLKLIFDLLIAPDDRPLGDYDANDPVSKNPGQVNPPDDDDDPVESPGFAAKDHIYEPPGSSTGFGGKYVTLDEVYYYYFGIIQEMLRDSDLTEEQRRMVMAYLDMLTGGLKSDNN